MKNNTKNNPFSQLIGQPIAKQRLLSSWESAKRGGPMLSPFIEGPAGNGKTVFADTLLGAMDQLDGVQTLSVRPNSIRTQPEFEDVMDFVNDSERWVLHVDECHRMYCSRNRTVWIDALNNFFMGALDGNNRNKSFEVKEGYMFNGFNPKKGSVVFTTNYPEKMDKALVSRFDKFTLKLYTVEELTEILILMLGKQGFKDLRPQTLRMIARCGRGTARPMEKIAGELKIISEATGGKRTLNREEVLQALIQTEIYPQGLNEKEIQLMQMVAERELHDTSILEQLQIERKSLTRSKGYLRSLNFIGDVGRSGVMTTDKGKRYIDSIAKEGFPLPTVIS